VKRIRFRVAALGLLVLVAATACSSSGNASSDKVQHVSVWAETGGWTDIDKTFVKSFNASHPNVQIDYTAQPDDTIIQTLLLALRTGSGPDMMFGPGVSDVEPGGFAARVGPLLDAATKQAYAPYLSGNYDYIINGQPIALPTAQVPVRLVYNKDLFQSAGLDPNSPPKTFSEVEADANAIYKSSGGKAYGYALPLAFDGYLPNFTEPMINAGNPSLTYFGLFDSQTQKFEMDAFAPAIQMYRDLISSKAMFPGSGTLNRDAMRAAFSSGKLGMYVGNSLEVGALGAQLKTKVNWGAAQLPVPDGQTLQAETSFIGSEMFVNSKPKNMTATAEVYNAWMGPGRICPLAKAGVIYPTSLTVLKDPSCQPGSGIPGYKDFEPTSFDHNPAPSPATSITVSGQSYDQAIAALILNNANIDSTLNGLAARYDAAYQAAVKAGKVKASDYGG
jgi:multiple sugar transport system substrate-binding protein